MTRLSPTSFSVLTPALVGIYLDAMNYPQTMFAGRVNAWRHAIIEPGFLAFAVFAYEESATSDQLPSGEIPPNSTPVGVCYGSLGSHLDWWYATVRDGLWARGEASEVLRNYFELTEIHVAPDFQGHGLGRILLEHLADAVVACTPAQRILLSTPEVPQESNGAFGLYRKMGFVDVLRDFYFPGDERPFAILGAELPLHPHT